MEIRAHAKINIGLDVTGKRADGYHEVRMIMQTIGLHDILSVDRTDEPQITITTDRDDLPAGSDNLIYKAARLMLDEYGLQGGINVDLNKNIPVAAGLAGGSTDAAATIVAINELYGLGLSQAELMKTGVRVGADVPFCIMGGCAMAEGIGEILTPIKPRISFDVLLAKPAEGVSTKYVYEHLDTGSIKHPDIDAIAAGLESGDIEKITGNMGNVLESVTALKVPDIGNIERVMRDCPGTLKAMMSGSGPSVFGLYEASVEKEAAEHAYRSVEESGYAQELYITRFV